MRLNLVVRPPFRHAATAAWLGAAAVIAIVVIWGAALEVRLAAAARTLAVERSQVTILQGELRAAQAMAAPRQRARAIVSSLNEAAVDPTIFRRMEAVAPDGLWLTNADLSRDRLTLNGTVTEWKLAAAFAERLAGVSGMLHVELRSVHARGRAGGYDFAVTATVARPPLERIP